MEVQNKNILIIDDDLPIAEAVKVALEADGLNIEIVSSASEIDSKINNLTPDLILLDIWLDGVSGQDVAAKLRKEEKTKNIPIIIMSANTDTEKIQKEMKAQDFLNKPFDIEELIKKVQKHLK